MVSKRILAIVLSLLIVLLLFSGSLQISNSISYGVWNKTYGGIGNDYGYSVVQTSDGGYAIAGSTNSS